MQLALLYPYKDVVPRQDILPTRIGITRGHKRLPRASYKFGGPSDLLRCPGSCGDVDLFGAEVSAGSEDCEQVHDRGGLFSKRFRSLERRPDESAAGASIMATNILVPYCNFISVYKCIYLCTHLYIPELHHRSAICAFCAGYLNHNQYKTKKYIGRSRYIATLSVASYTSN